MILKKYERDRDFSLFASANEARMLMLLGAIIAFGAAQFAPYLGGTGLAYEVLKIGGLGIMLGLLPASISGSRAHVAGNCFECFSVFSIMAISVGLVSGFWPEVLAFIGGTLVGNTFRFIWSNE